MDAQRIQGGAAGTGPAEPRAVRPLPQPAAAPFAEPDPLQWERLLSGIAASFIKEPLHRFDEVLADALRQVVLALDLDRCTISEGDDAANEMRVVQSWGRPGVVPMRPGPSAKAFPWVAARMRAGLPVACARLEDLPPEAAAEAEILRGFGLRAHVSLPIHAAGRFISVLSFGMVRAERDWPESLLARMRLLADLFGSFLARKLAQDRIDEQLRFERMLADVSTTLASAGGEGAHAELQSALVAAARFLRADRVCIYRTDPESARLVALHTWQARDARGEPLLPAGDEPRTIHALLAGEIVHTSRGADGDAGELLAIPLLARHSVVGALSLARVAGTDRWPDEFLPRLEVFGHKMVGAAARVAAEESARRALLEAAEHREHLAHLARVEAVGAMSAAIAHEINQPLAAIRNYALAAQRRLVDPDAIDSTRLIELMEKIGAQAGAAGEVLDRIRAWVVKRRAPGAARTDVGALFTQALRLIEIEAGRHEVRTHTRVPPSLPPAMGDEIQLQQVILNLARNAIEAMASMPPGTRVLHLAASRAAGQILIEVRDTGPGVLPDAVQRLFDPFHTTRAAGLGIGLAISRAIVEAHGGELWYEPYPAGGSSFRFTVPAAAQGA